MNKSRTIIIPLIILIVFFMILFISENCFAQSKKTRISRIEIDGKRYKGKYQILTYLNNETFEAKLEKDSFLLPSVLESESNILVHLIVGRYNLNLGLLPIARFDNIWEIKIFRYPYLDFEMTRKEKKETKLIYLLQFENGGEIIYKVR